MIKRGRKSDADKQRKNATLRRGDIGDKEI
jgi:hypothetical protein